jgi:hypothetical protein
MTPFNCICFRSLTAPCIRTAFLPRTVKSRGEAVLRTSFVRFEELAATGQLREGGPLPRLFSAPMAVHVYPYCGGGLTFPGRDRPASLPRRTHRISTHRRTVQDSDFDTAGSGPDEFETDLRCRP